MTDAQLDTTLNISFTILQTNISPIMYVCTAAFWYPAEGRHQIETAVILQEHDDKIEVLQKKIHGSTWDESQLAYLMDYSKIFHVRISKILKKVRK